MADPMPAGSAKRRCAAALEAGYRHVDTASFYGNEESVGAAVRASGIPREEIFVTTKLWNSDHANPERAFETSLRKLKLDYIDLYLIHYPVPQRAQSWRAFERLKQQGKSRSIGVSNFTIRHLTELLAADGNRAGNQSGRVSPLFISARAIGFLRRPRNRHRGLLSADSRAAAERFEAGGLGEKVRHSFAAARSPDEVSLSMSTGFRADAGYQVYGANPDPLGDPTPIGGDPKIGEPLAHSRKRRCLRF